MQENKIALKIHRKSRFQPNEKNFGESCSVRHKDLLRAKKILGVIGTLKSLNQPPICYSFPSKIVAAIFVYRMSLTLVTPNATENIVSSLAQPMEIDVFFDSLCC